MRLLISQNIVLTGFMGTGKTVTGQMLADRLEMLFIDTDREVEAATGLDPSEIFRRYGEKHFRAEESLVVDRVARLEGCVIATGGGVVLNADNMANLRRKGVIILLEARPEVIARRVSRVDDRPLLSESQKQQQLPERIEALVRQRAPYYDDHDFRVDTSEASPERVVAEILAYLERGPEARSQKSAPGHLRRTGMDQLRLELGERSYQIMIGFADLDQLGANLQPLKLANRICLITNTTVGKLYGGRVKSVLADSGYTVSYYEVPDGEEYKTLQSAAAIYDYMIDAGMERGSAVVALGGGVVGDLVGFAAATYMRGIPLIQVPTTLLAQVDSSVGGKVAVNHPRGKNLIGCFYQPRLVFADLQTLRTLPEREIIAGMAEVIKYGVIWDSTFFAFLEQHLGRILNLEPDALMETVKRSCAIKAEIVSRDEREDGLRAILNFGHTIGHALESLTNYQVYRHGEAIAAGMAAAATLAAGRGMQEAADRERLVALLRRTGLPVSFPYPARDLMGLLSHDKKVFEGRPRFVLPLKIGEVEICSNLEDEEILAALSECSRQ